MIELSQLLREDRSMELLRLIGKAFHASLDLESLLQTTLQHLLMLASAEAGSIWMLDDERRHLHCTLVVGPDTRTPVAAHLDLDEGIPGWAVMHRLPALLPDVRSDPRWSPQIEVFAERETRTLLVTPLIAGGRPLGAITIHNRLDGQAFSEAELDLLTILGDHVALAFQNALLFQREHRAREIQAMLRSVSQHFHSTLDLDVLLPNLFRELSTVLNCEALSLWLVERQSSMLVCAKAQGGADEALIGMRVPLGEGIVGRVGSSQLPMLIEDAQSDPRLYRSIDATTGFVTRSIICAPMIRQGVSIGVIEAINKLTPDGHFASEDLDLLINLASSAALAIENARLYKDLASSYDSTLEALAAALDLRDRETEGHSRRVVAYTVRLARDFGLPDEQVQEIARGALLHDVGKIGVPDAILRKPGLLQPHEWEIMHRHPQLGYDMLSGISYLSMEAEIVLAHQEKYDGTGYPRGLRGDEIPLGARLFAIADAYDAITSDRPYRQSKSHAEAVEEIIQGAGQQFDPFAVQVFLTVPAEEWQALKDVAMNEAHQRRAAQHR